MPSDPYPTPNTIAEWDDPSLFAVTGFQAADRARVHGFDALNDIERVFCCLFQFDGDVNNGGFGMWIGDTHPKMLLATVSSLHKIGAAPMALFVERMLSDLEGLARFDTILDWQEQYRAMPESYHESVESLSSEFVELEPSFLESAYAFARANWQQVRTA